MRGKLVERPLSGFWDASTVWPTLVLVLLAPVIGSFLGVLVRRLPRGRPVALARSCCEACGAVLGLRDLVPVASYLALRGRCRRCGAPIGAFHIAIELAATGVALGTVAAGPSADPAMLLLGCGLGWTLLALAWTDWECWRLPDALTLPLLLAGLAQTALLDPDALTEHAAGAALGYAVLCLLGVAYRAWRGRDGIGRGDAKLLAAGGAWLGLAWLPDLILLAALCGLGTAFAASRGRRLTSATPVPFGPGLALAIWLAWLWSDRNGQWIGGAMAGGSW